jgi:hypothetical protein
LENLNRLICTNILRKHPCYAATGESSTCCSQLGESAGAPDSCLQTCRCCSAAEGLGWPALCITRWRAAGCSTWVVESWVNRTCRCCSKPVQTEWGCRCWGCMHSGSPSRCERVQSLGLLLLHPSPFTHNPLQQWQWESSWFTNWCPSHQRPHP